MTKSSSFVLFATSFACIATLPAQVDRANLAGTITDASGAAVSAVEIRAIQAGTGFERTAFSGEAGLYALPGLPVGAYTVTFSRAGFRTIRQESVVLTTGQRRTIDAVLQLSAVATQVEVQASAVALDQTSAEIGSAIESKQIREIPINGRNWSALMALAPGAINSGDGTQNSIRFFGRARDENNWTFDGVDATGVKDPRQEGNLRLVISMDSIAEFKVNSSNYTAESGTGAGAQVNVVSKSGTNEFHGGLFEFLRNDKLDARRPFDPAQTPPFRLNQFGANLGGRIVPNRTFFYANYEGLRQRLGQAAVNGLVPSAALRERVLATSPALRPLIDKWTVGQRPTANPLIDQFTGIFNQRWREDSGMIRVDHRFSDKTSSFFRFNTVDGNFTDRRSTLLEFRESFFRPSNFTAQLQRVFSPTILNETKLGMNRSALTRPQVGIFPEGLEVPGLTTTTTSTGIRENATSYSLIDNLAVMRGRHNLKFGGEARRIHMNVGNDAEVSVRYASMDAFIRNSADRIQINGTLATMGVRRNYWLGFAQDEFKVSQSLTLNLGARYEYYTVSHEVNGRGKVFDLYRCQGFCAPGAAWYFPDRNNLAPRLGLAWSPRALGGKTVLRTGYGMFFGTGQNDDVTAAIDSEAERFQLTSREAPALSYPASNFISLAQSTGLQPRSVQRDRRDMYSQQWNFTIQQELPWAMVAQAGYVGNRGVHQFNRTRVNLIDPVTRVRPLPSFSDIDEKGYSGQSTFHGLQMSLQRSFVRGWLWQTQYMWSHAIDDNAGSGDGVERMIASCRRCERGNADFDVRHTVTVNSIYDLPFARGRRLGGWSVSGLATARSGRPVTPTIERSSAAVPDGNARGQRPNLVPGVPLIPAGGQVKGEAWINPAAFAAPANGTWGNLGRNTIIGPGLWQVDFALNKQTRINEQARVEFRAEAFNLFNVAQFGNPQSNLSRGDFGLIRTPANSSATGFGNSRQFQFMLRFVF